MVLRRKVTYYVVNLVCPVIFLTLLGLVTYFIEDNADLKLKTPFAIMLAYLFIQTLITTLIPPSRATPYIALYVLACLALTTASNVGAALCYYLATKEGEPPERAYYILVVLMGFPFYPSRWTACCAARKHSYAPLHCTVLLCTIQYIQCCTRTVHVQYKSNGAGRRSRVGPSAEGERGQHTLSGGVDEKDESKWEEIAAALNRLFAIIYVIAALVFFGVFLIPIFISYGFNMSN